MPETRFSARIVAAVVLAAVTVVGIRSGTAQAKDFDHDDVRELHQEGKIVSLETIIADAQRRYGGGHVLEAELQRRPHFGLVYEIEFLDNHGTMHELYYSAKTGKLLMYEVFVTDSKGRLHSYDYDVKNGRLLPHDDSDDEN